jgi:DNA-binding GntR family transcriptional regulator
MNQNSIYMTKTDVVYGVIKKNIISGQWAQGEDIPIKKVAAELSVSAIPVREALQRLASEGIVVTEPHKGAKVMSFDRDKIREVISIRAVLEGYAGRTAVPMITREDLRKINEMAALLEEYARRKDSEKFGLANKEFHKYIYQKSPFPLLYEMLIKLWEGGKWSTAAFSFCLAHMKASVREHRLIIKAIEDRDGDRVETLIRRHKMRTVEILEKTVLSEKGRG